MEEKAAEKADIQRLTAPDMQVNEELEVDMAGPTPGQVDFDAIEEIVAKLAVAAA